MNEGDDDALLRLAEAIADETPVDWEREKAARKDLGRRLDQFRVVEAIAAMHRAPPPEPSAPVRHDAATAPRPRRAAWWIYPVAASFLAYAALIHHGYFSGPRLGMNPEPGRGGMTVRDLERGSPADRAGLRDGDLVLSVDGRIIRSGADWSSIRSNLESGRPLSIRIDREDQPLDMVLMPTTPSWRVLGRVHLTLRVVLAAAQLITLALALLIALGRPKDRLARVGSLSLAAIGTIYFAPPYGFAATWRHLPSLLNAALWIPFVASLATAPLLFSFFALFPRALFRGRRAWALVWLPWLIVAPAIVRHHFLEVYEPHQAIGDLPDWYLSAFGSLGAAYVVAGLAALTFGYRRLEEINDRRRVRVLVVGALVGLLAILPLGALLTSGRVSGGRGESFLSMPGQLLSAILFMLFPLSFAYAVLRHRLFDVRVMIRQGLQYTLARRFLLSLVPVLAAALAGDLLVHRDRPLGAVLGSRGWAYLTVGVLALVAHARRGRWLDGLDRRFFREEYDAHRLLREVVEDVREADRLEPIAPRVVARIEAALHPEFAALLVRESHQSSYRTLASSPAGQAPPDLPEGKLPDLVRLLGRPVEVTLSDSGWLEQRLPPEENDFLRRARLGLLVPVASQRGSREALLGLGQKRSEEPYTTEDQDVLMAIAASLAILLEKPSEVAARDSAWFEECPSCGACYDSSAGHCARDGSTLDATPLPRRLAGRYRLERRIGQGGMGRVYEAADTALERRVAVKLIRDHLLQSAEAVERFQREARVAAAFAHPNLVTIHDFGLAAGARPYIVMELLSGRTLRDELERQRRLAPRRAVDILRGVCAAVEAAHQRDLVHRDLKPANVFLAGTETGEAVKLLDFGVAKLMPSGTEWTNPDTDSGVLVGTPRYMAPEQLRGETASPAWDVWALALITYEMLTGAHPFPATTVAELRRAVLSGRFVSVSIHLPEAPPRWQEFFQGALHTDPGRRPSSARLFLSELERTVI